MNVKIIIVGLFAIGLPIGVLQFHSHICTSVMIFTLLYVIQGQNGMKTYTMRKHIIMALMTVVVCLIFLTPATLHPMLTFA